MKMLCRACPRQCNKIRREKENEGGYCGMPLFPVVAKATLHFWEEPCISGNRGSGTVFFSGCSLNCVYCQNYEISHNKKGELITPKRLSEIFRELEEKGAHNINLVNPTHYLWAIKEALSLYHPKIPIVYNSGGYDLPEAINENIFDIYLMDLKYLSEEKSFKYSNAKDYPLYATESIRAAYKLCEKPVFDDEGIMQKGLIIRHLCLPLNIKEALKVVDWVKENTPNAYLSIMSQYFPTAKAYEYKEINRKITQREYEKVLSYVMEKNLENVFIQERNSADKGYVPVFDLQGVKNKQYILKINKNA
ncbi:MAG: radical SAM protein [Acutalibacteraceae bacterium]|nr:radical SAM protein [Acutalibacteraceae bacterium]